LKDNIYNAMLSTIFVLQTFFHRHNCITNIIAKCNRKQYNRFGNRNNNNYINNKNNNESNNKNNNKINNNNKDNSDNKNNNNN